MRPNMSASHVSSQSDWSQAQQGLPSTPLVSPKFPHVPLGVGGWPLVHEEWRCCANCPSN